MITFITATPGSGKTLLATSMLLDLSRENIKNLKYNYYYFKAFKEQLENNKLWDDMFNVLTTTGQGQHRKKEIIILDSEYYSFLEEEYKINTILDGKNDDLINNFPEYYYERISIINEKIELLNEEYPKLKLRPFKPVRTIYTNIKDLILSQARPLPLDMDWRKTPHGSFFAIDECQLIPMFSDEFKGSNPIVNDLTIHRHSGYDFIFITQDPSFTNKYIRKLATHHIHLVNIYGFEQSFKFEWSTCQDQPNSARSLIKTENVSRWFFPKHVYGVYKSTTINTRKKRVPKKLVFWGGLAVLFVLAGVIYLVSNATDGTVAKFIKGEEIAEITSNNSQKENNSASLQGDAEQKVSNQGNSISNPSALSALANGHTGTVGNNNNSQDNSHQRDGSVQQPVYDPADPYGYTPVNSVSPVSYPVFAGCVSFKNQTYAVTQQGTRISGISPRDCQKLLDRAIDRPFNYFKQDASVDNSSKSDERETDNKRNYQYSQVHEHTNNSDQRVSTSANEALES